MCLNTKEHFESMHLVFIKYGINNTEIVKNCNRTAQYAGCINGVYLKWVWADDFKKLSEDDIQEILNQEIRFTNSKKVICLNNLQVFGSAEKAASYYGLRTSTGISKCCLGIRKCSGKNELNESLRWMYYDDYKKLPSKQKVAIANFKKSYKKPSIPTKVICLNTLEVFNTCKDTENFITIKGGKRMLEHIDNNKPFAKNPLTNEPLYWMRLKDYENKTDKEKDLLKSLYYTGSFLLPENRKECFYEQ